MSDDRATPMRRIAIELDRLSQKIRVIQHVLDDGGVECGDEIVRRLSYLATRARRIAEMVEQDSRADAAG
jgi:hypothetical protein